MTEAIEGPDAEARPRGNRLPKAELEARVGEILKLLIAGVTSPEDLWRFVTEKTRWGISARTLERYIAKANQRLQKAAAFDRQIELGKAIARLNHLFSQHVTQKDWRAALAAQREINELLGLYAPRRVALAAPDDPSGTGGPSDFVVLIPAGPATNEEWEHRVKQEQQQRLLASASTPTAGG